MIFIVSVLVLSLAWPFLVQASFVIHLKDGGQYSTAQYWEEDGQIKFMVQGGVMGIDKNDVQKIVKTKDVIPSDDDDTPRAAQPPSVPVKKPEAEVKTNGKKTKVAKDAPDTPGKDKGIMSEYRALKKRFDARSGLTVDELQSLRADLIELRNRISNDKQLSETHAVEETKLNDMQFFVNNLIKRSKLP